MEEHRCRDDGIVVYNYLAGELGAIANDALVANHAIVCDVHILHEQVVVADDGGTLRCCTSRDGDILTYGVVVAYLANRVLALELQVLRLC